MRTVVDRGASTRSLARHERRRGDLRARQRRVAHPRRPGDARRRHAGAARAGARAAGDGRRRPAQQVPRGPVGSARAHHQLRDRHDLRRHRGRGSRGARVRKVHARIHGVDPVTGRRVRGQRSRPAALDPRGRGRVVRARVPHVRGAAVAKTTPTATWSRWRASPRWSSCRRHMAPQSMGELREYLRSVRGAAGHAGRVRRPARRPVPADAACSTGRCGRSRPPRRSRSCPATRAACTGSRGSRRRAAAGARRDVRAQPGAEPGDADAAALRSARECTNAPPRDEPRRPRRRSARAPRITAEHLVGHVEQLEPRQHEHEHQHRPDERVGRA